ncbi:MAG: hypothetical protein ACE5Q6_09300 [Dehalococcoidia bacterium]
MTTTLEPGNRPDQPIEPLDQEPLDQFPDAGATLLGRPGPADLPSNPSPSAPATPKQVARRSGMSQEYISLWLEAAVPADPMAGEDPPPKEIVIDLTPEELAASEPVVVRPGEGISIGLRLANPGPDPATREALLFPIDAEDRPQEGLHVTTILESHGIRRINLEFQLPEDAVPGYWDFRIYLWDPDSFRAGNPDSYLVSRTIEGVLEVR